MPDLNEATAVLLRHIELAHRDRTTPQPSNETPKIPDPYEAAAVLMRHIELAYRLRNVIRQTQPVNWGSYDTLTRVIGQLETQLAATPMQPDPPDP